MFAKNAPGPPQPANYLHSFDVLPFTSPATVSLRDTYISRALRRLLARFVARVGKCHPRDFLFDLPCNIIFVLMIHCQSLLVSV